jgi:hypothetical protein
MVVEKGHIMSVRLTDELRERIDRAAEKAALTTADWVRSVLALAANQGAFAPRRTHGARRRKD